VDINIKNEFLNCLNIIPSLEINSFTIDCDVGKKFKGHFYYFIVSLFLNIISVQY